MKFLLGVLISISLGSLIYFAPNLYEHFGTRYESARRNVYEDNYSYVRGKIQHIERLKLDYETADELHKKAFKQAILDEASTIEFGKLPSHLQGFINNLRRSY